MLAELKLLQEEMFGLWRADEQGHKTGVPVWCRGASGSLVDVDLAVGGSEKRCNQECEGRISPNTYKILFLCRLWEVCFGVAGVAEVAV